MVGQVPGNGDPGKVVVSACKTTHCPGCAPTRRYLEHQAIIKAFERVTPPGARLALFCIEISENHIGALVRRIQRAGKVFESIPVGRNQFDKKMYYVITDFFVTKRYGEAFMKCMRHPMDEIAGALTRWHESDKDGHRSCSKALRAPTEDLDESGGAGDPPGHKTLVVPVRDIRVTMYRLRERRLVEDDRGYVVDLNLGQFDEGFDFMLAYISGKSDRPPEAYHRPDRSVFRKVA